MPKREPFFIADTGASIIYGEWFPDPEQEAAKLLRLSRVYDDWSEPMALAAEAIIRGHEKGFATETDPYGQKWHPLNPDYRMDKVRSGYPPDILYRTGAMAQAATGEDSLIVTEREIMFNESVLPEYGPLHQTGVLAPEDYNVHQAKAFRELPQRMFIGISDETANEIEIIFVEWANRVAKTFYPSDVDIPTPPMPGDMVWTTSGKYGKLTDVPGFGGGRMVRGPTGFIGMTYDF